ncbi:MAG TPA: twin-arginine translocase TatA/TatE family subunit [Kofleriaceae bacterium]
MFGMGGTEIIVILIVALLFLGPDKLPEAAKQISKGIRDIKKQSRVLQRTIEDDEHIGGAIRDLKSALRGDEEPLRPRPIKPKQIEAMVATATAGALAAPEHAEEVVASTPHDAASAQSVAEHAPIEALPPEPKVTLSALAGEHDGDAKPSDDDDAELAAMIKPAPDTVARVPVIAAPAPVVATAAKADEPATPTTPSETPEPKHG